MKGIHGVGFKAWCLIGGRTQRVFSRPGVEAIDRKGWKEREWLKKGTNLVLERGMAWIDKSEDPS